MKTVVAETVMLGREAFETLGDVQVIPDRTLGPEHLKDADALIIRSKTKVTPELLKDSSVRFVGTATAGFEHIDFQALEKNHIGWTASPGCNAASVADYISAALSYLHTFKRVGLEGKTLGIIGVGQVGSRVAARAKALGLRVLLNDPPRAAREFPTLGKNEGEISEVRKNPPRPSGTPPMEGNSLKTAREKEIPSREGCPKGGVDFDVECLCFMPLEKLLAQSDIVTMHVPLITEKPWPTLRMADCRFFEKMKRGSIFINASRGNVLDADALLHAKENGIISRTVLDVWNPEPGIRTEILDIADIGTAHIAGHSLEGKLNGTVQVYHEACQFFGIEPVWDPAPLLPALVLPELNIDSRGKTDPDVLAEAALAAYDIMADDKALRETPEKFDALRSSYGVRREFFNTRVTLSETRPELIEKLRRFGFKIYR